MIVDERLQDCFDPVVILVDSGSSFEVNDGIVPSRNVERVLIPAGTDVTIWPMKDAGDLSIGFPAPPLRIGLGHVADDFSALIP